MSYRICIGKSDPVVLYDSNFRRDVLDPTHTEEVDKAGSLEFTLPFNHPAYDSVNQHKPFVYLYEDGAEIWRGRITKTTIAQNKSKTVYCEGDLAFLCDSIRRPYKWEDLTIQEAFEKLVKAHNNQVEASKRFVVGKVDNGDEEIDCENSSYTSTWEELNNIFVSGESMHIRTRFDGATRYIDLLEKGYGVRCNQSVRFGRNLLEVSVEENSEDIYTCLIPVGKELSSDSTTSRTSAGTSGGVSGSSSIVSIAIKQIGHYGSDNNKFTEGRTEAWCNDFVTWCAKHAGISSKQIAYGASTTATMNRFKAWGRFQYKGKYTPNPGDIIYFKSAGASHVGIVEKYSGGRVHTIEGNVGNDDVARRDYAPSHATITGYGVYDAKDSSGSSGASTKSAKETYTGTTKNARFYAYMSGEGGTVDALGNKLDYRNKTCAVPKEIKLGTKIQLHIDGHPYDGEVYTATDHGDSNISVWSDGSYGIDILVGSRSEENKFGGTSTRGTITIIDGSSQLVDGSDSSDGSQGGTVTIKSFKDIDDGEFVHKRGKDYIYSKAGVAEYGKIFKAVQWSKVTSPARLVSKAKRRLRAHMKMKRTVSLTAVDIAELGGNVDKIRLGADVATILTPLGIRETFTCSKITRVLNNPAENKYEFGTTRRSLTAMQSTTATIAADAIGEELGQFEEE